MTVAVDIGLAVVVIVAMSGPVPVSLARAHWPRTRPRLAVAAWFAVGGAWWLGLAGLVAAVALEPVGLPLFLAVMAVAAEPGLLTGDLRWLALGVAAAVVVVGPLVALAVTVVAAVTGSRHAARLRLLGDWDAEQRALVVPAGAAVAWTLPGLARGTVVVSSGCLDRLPPAERAAVLAHEHAHARARDFVLLAWFRGWAQLVPLRGPRLAECSVAMLLEMVADRAACRVVGPRAVAEALWLQAAPGDQPWWRPAPATLGRLRCLDTRR